jgi:hypothetical protein
MTEKLLLVVILVHPLRCPTLYPAPKRMAPSKLLQRSRQQHQRLQLQQNRPLRFQIPPVLRLLVARRNLPRGEVNEKSSERRACRMLRNETILERRSRRGRRDQNDGVIQRNAPIVLVRREPAPKRPLKKVQPRHPRPT